MNVSPLASIASDQAMHVQLPPVYNFASFDSLPLVEFVPQKGLNPKRVLELLKTDPQENQFKKNSPKKANKRDKALASEWNEDQEQVMNFAQDHEQTDPFTLKLLDLLDTQTQREYKPIEVDEVMLKALRFEHVYI